MNDRAIARLPSWWFALALGVLALNLVLSGFSVLERVFDGPAHDAARPFLSWLAPALSGVTSALALGVLVSAYRVARRGAGQQRASMALLFESEERNRLLLESTGEGIYGIDPDGRCTFANPACARLLGYDSPSDLLGRNMHEMVHHSRNDGSPLPAEECRIYRAYQAGVGTHTDDEVFWRRDRSSFPVEYRSYPILRDGRKLGAVVTFVDISSRRRADAAMRLRERALREVAQGIFITDPRSADEPITYVNAAFERLTGYPPAEVKGRYLDFLCGTETDPAAVAALAEAFQEGLPYEGEVRFYRKDGTEFWCNLSIAPVRETADRVSHFVGVLTDVTAPKRVAEELHAAKEAAEAANQAKSQFLANMSHELRTPLNAVILYSELLMEEAEDHHVTQFIPDLDKIRAAGKHLLALVNGVLDLSKIEAGKMELHLETFDVAVVAREVASTVEPLAHKRDNAFTVACPDDVGAMHADLTKVRQVLFNLLANAFKFTEKGTVTLAVEREADGAFVRFSIRDNGIGMSAEQEARLFQPFAQADTSTTRKYGGTGLGLVIARHFCEMMGGTLALHSVLGQGTTFTVRLPLRVAPPAPPPAAANEKRPGTGTVLVIDDEPAVRDWMARFLTGEGFHAITAADGEAGLRLARQARPDVILLDVMMPRLDGWAVLSALKADPQLAAIPVILLTITEDQNLGYLLGAADHLPKPVDRDRLATVLKQYAADHRAGPVLLVEDDDATRQVLRRMLAREGWPVAEAPNGRAALERVAENRPGLILLDLMMPEMDGFEFLTELRRQPEGRDIPVVVLTAKDLTAEDRQRLGGTVERVVQKGAYNRAELLREVRRLVVSYTTAKIDKPAEPAEPTPLP